MDPISMTTDPLQRQALAKWLMQSESFSDRLETTPIGRKTARVGRVVKEYHFNFYNLAYCTAALIALAGQRSWVSSAVAETAKAAQHATPVIYLTAFSAFCLSKAASVALRDTQSFSHEIKNGSSIALASKAYARHLAAEAKSSSPNPYSAATFFLKIGSWTLGKLGLEKASLRMDAKMDKLRQPSVDFNNWRADTATQARLMRNPEWRSTDAYKEATRYLLACEYGHFRPHVEQPVLSFADDQARAGLAIGFDKAFPSPYDHGCLDDKQKIRKFRADRIDSNNALSKILAEATQFDADPRFAPKPDLPSLAELVASCEKARIAHEQAFHASTRPAPELQARMAPWAAAIEAQALSLAAPERHVNGTDVELSAPCANAPRRATRL